MLSNVCLVFVIQPIRGSPSCGLRHKVYMYQIFMLPDSRVLTRMVLAVSCPTHESFLKPLFIPP